jgi:hypothetical protein
MLTTSPGRGHHGGRARIRGEETEIAELNAENKRLERALAAAHAELHRRGDTGTTTPADVGDTVTDLRWF